MAAAKKIRPPAELNLRPHTGDRKVSVRRLKTLQAFQSINFGDTEGMSGTLVLRRYRAGEVICAQNEPAYTAFYILSRQDVIELGQEPEGLAELVELGIGDAVELVTLCGIGDAVRKYQRNNVELVGIGDAVRKYQRNNGLWTNLHN